MADIPGYCPSCGAVDDESLLFCPACGCQYKSSVPGESALLRGRYEILEMKKQKSSGSIYKARNVQTGKISCIKKMVPEFCSPADYEKAIRWFWETLDSLEKSIHPGIPIITDRFEETDPVINKAAYYIVSDYAEGRNLHEIMKERDEKCFDPYCVLNFLSQLVDILNCLHSLNPPVIHGNINPDSILIQPPPHSPLFFPVPKVVGKHMTDKTTLFQQTMKDSSPAYPGIEKIHGLKDLSRTKGGGRKVFLTGLSFKSILPPYKSAGEPGVGSDIHSLGLLMYYLLTGILPAPGDLRSLKPVVSLNDEVTETLSALIMAMISQDISKRPRSVNEIINLLQDRKAYLDKSMTKMDVLTHPRWQEELFLSLSSLGANVNVRDHNSMTPLHYAARTGDVGDIAGLISKGAEINATTDYGWTPLLLAVDRNHNDSVEYLTDMNADIHQANSQQKTPLHLAVFRGNRYNTKILLKAGADVNAITKEKITPLHIASGEGYNDVVKLLLDYGADIDPEDFNGITPLSQAVLRGKKETTALLLEYGADINSSDNNGWTPLHWAAQRGHEDIVNLLIEKGADIEAADREGETPMDLAKNFDREKVIRILKKLGAKEKSFWQSGFLRIKF